MVSKLPKIQIKKVASMWAVSFVVWIAGIFLVSIIAGLIIATFLENPNVFEIILGAISMGLFVIGWLFVLNIIFYSIGIWRLTTINYEFGKDVLTLRGGIIAKYEKNLLFSKIQHVVITQRLWERIFGISNLIIQTAGGGDNMAIQQQNGQNQQIMINGPTIPALLKEDAEMLRDEIISRVEKFKDQGL